MSNAFTIPAEVHTDDRTAEANFDALAWFEQADDTEILELAACGWGGDRPADQVALHLEDKIPEVAEVFTVQHALRRKGDMGFECHVEEEPALAWLKENRPWLHAILENQDIPALQRTSHVEAFSAKEVFTGTVWNNYGSGSLFDRMINRVAQGIPTAQKKDWKSWDGNVHVTQRKTPNPDGSLQLVFYVVIQATE